MPERKKTRPDDARGTPKGAGTMPGGRGGRIGNPPFIPTEEQRAQVRTLAQTFPIHNEHLIARLIGIHKDTLRRHFADDLELGRAQMLAQIGGQMISRAINADAVDGAGKPIAKGDLKAQEYVLARLGGWTTKVELTGKGGRPIEHVDLSGLSEEQLEAYGKLAAAAAGEDVGGEDEPDA